MGAKRDGSSKEPANSLLPPRRDVTTAPKSKLDAPTTASTTKPLSAANAAITRPLAPPPRPPQPQVQKPPSQQGQDSAAASSSSSSTSTESPHYFASQIGGGGAGAGGSLSLELNPFEQSFGAPPVETPGGTKLPPVAALTSPSSLLPGTGVTPFPWGGSLRTGPLSPAMLSGPTADYFTDAHHMRGGFPTPNESSLRTGLTPGGSGSMFPAASPSTQALFGLSGTVPTPSTVEFHRTAAAAKHEGPAHAQAPQPMVTSQAHEAHNGTAALPTNGKPKPKPPTGPFDPHDNDAANGLFLLAQGRNGAAQPPQASHYPAPPLAPPPNNAQPPPPAPVAAHPPQNVSPHMNGASSAAGSSACGMSEAASVASEESNARPTTRAKGKRNSTTGVAAVNGRRKAEEPPPAKAPASKKAKASCGSSSGDEMDEMRQSDDEKTNPDGSKAKMTEEERRKNFLERNRVAALKCRQRKKQWLANLQNKVELYSQENDLLTGQVSQLRDEVVNLKALLLAHKDCPITQQGNLQGGFGPTPSLEGFSQSMNPYGMGGPMANQPGMPGHAPTDRRFS